MPGLELLYHSISRSITCPQDVLVCFVHWEMIKRGYKCIGSGDQPRSSDRKSELLPADWNSNKDLYILRYKTKDKDTQLLLKGIAADSGIIFNLMNTSTQKVSDLVLNFNDHVNSEHLHSFDCVFIDLHNLTKLVETQLLPPRERQSVRKSTRSRRDEDQDSGREDDDDDPLRIPDRRPQQGTHSQGPAPLNSPFAVGGADLDPFRSPAGGGMIVDPLRSGYPRSGFDPSGGIPDILPPGAVPPGARFDPFGPVGRNRPGPDPDHMPPPGYDDMFM